MSHTPQRKEKDCLNCGATVQGRYCHVCGQENVEPKETLWHMVTHFFNDITHFDGSFFTTLKDLLFKPGFLSKEYMKGRRARYLHPVRMYVFTSAIFFLIFFSLFNGSDIVKDPDKPLGTKQRADFMHKLEALLKKDTGNIHLKDKLAHASDTARPLTSKDTLITDSEKDVRIDSANKDYRTFEEYDSVEKTLPTSQRDGWFLRRIVKKKIEIINKYRDNPQEARDKLGGSILHRLPYMLFVSLPLFALILRLVYIRRKWRKLFFIADHGVFTIHLYVFSFILLLLVFALDALQKATHWKFINLVIYFFIFILFFYLNKAMRNFYGQGRWKTFLKFLLVAFASFIMMLIVFLFFIIFSAATL